MPPPTLLVKGKLKSPVDDPEEQKTMDKIIPIEYAKQWFFKRTHKTGIENRVLILKSQTASGKSTAFVAEIFIAMVLGKTKAGMICTQPRTLTAIRNVDGIMEHYYRTLTKGETIGYSSKYDKLKPKANSILSATIGTLTQQLYSMTDEQIMEKYSYILIDETHERDLNIDMAIYMLKNLLLRNAHRVDCPFVVLMSATFSPDKFLKYFGVPKTTNYIRVEGRSYGIEQHWAESSNRDYIDEAVKVVRKICLESQDDPITSADILVFLTGTKPITSLGEKLDELNVEFARGGKKIMAVLKIDSTAQRENKPDYVKLDIPLEKQTVEIEGKKYPASRRVILTTNVAETGLTLPNLKYVLDSGFNNETEFNPNYGTKALIPKPAPRSRITQRMGRAGRNFNGHFYPLYPKDVFDSLQKIQLPDILKQDFTMVMLQVIMQQLKAKALMGKEPKFSVADIDMLDVPTPDALQYSLERLYSLGFISNRSIKYDEDESKMLEDGEITDNYGITRLGLLARRISGDELTTEMIRMVLAGYSWGASILDLITIGAFLSVDESMFKGGSPFDRPKWSAVYEDGAPSYFARIDIYKKIKLLLADNFIDGIFLFEAVVKIIDESKPEQVVNNLHLWCERNFFNLNGIFSFIQIRDNMIDSMIGSGFNVLYAEDKSIRSSRPENFMERITAIKYCIYDGYRLNVAIRQSNGEYHAVNRHMVIIKPSIFNEDKTKDSDEKQAINNILPNYILYDKIELKKLGRKCPTYKFIAPRISTLDGFVNIDPFFTN